jgi:hypothetical protein
MAGSSIRDSARAAAARQVGESALALWLGASRLAVATFRDEQALLGDGPLLYGRVRICQPFVENFDKLS